MAKIMLDPGHGGNDSGAVGPTGLKESNVVLSIAQKLGKLLTANGHTISYTRTGDTYPSINARCAQANNEKVDYFVSIHCNSNGPTAVGIETLVYSTTGTAYKLAQPVQKELLAGTGDRDRGIKVRTDLGVLKGTKMPAILTEVGFISHPATETKLKTDSYLELLAGAHAKGINTFLGK